MELKDFRFEIYNGDILVDICIEKYFDVQMYCFLDGHLIKLNHDLFPICLSEKWPRLSQTDSPLYDGGSLNMAPAMRLHTRWTQGMPI